MTPTPIAHDCGAPVCNVDQAGPRPAGGSTLCFTVGTDGKTEVYDLIGNVEEWTASCTSNVEQDAD